MLGEDEDEDPYKSSKGIRASNLESDSGDEGFSSEDESFKSSTEVFEKKVN
jgi:hypothetical protein